MNVLHSSFAFSKEGSPSCSISKALILERDVNVTSAMERPSVGMIAEAMNGGTGIQLRFGEDGERALVVRLVRASGSVESVILLQDGLAEEGLDANRVLGSI